MNILYVKQRRLCLVCNAKSAKDARIPHCGLRTLTCECESFGLGLMQCTPLGKQEHERHVNVKMM